MGHNRRFVHTSGWPTSTRSWLISKAAQGGLGYLKIASVLNDEGRATKKGGLWQSMSVRSVLMSAEKMAAA